MPEHDRETELRLLAVSKTDARQDHISHDTSHAEDHGISNRDCVCLTHDGWSLDCCVAIQQAIVRRGEPLMCLMRVITCMCCLVVLLLYSRWSTRWQNCKAHQFVASYIQQQASRVATPSFSSSHKEGPWPACKGMDGAACCALIEGYAVDIRGQCLIIPENSFVTMDFRSTRVRVFVDNDNVVTSIPSRG